MERRDERPFGRRFKSALKERWSRGPDRDRFVTLAVLIIVAPIGLRLFADDGSIENWHLVLSTLIGGGILFALFVKPGRF